MNNKDIKEICRVTGCGIAVARELLTLGGNDLQLVLDACMDSSSAKEAKANILDMRMTGIENAIAQLQTDGR